MDAKTIVEWIRREHAAVQDLSARLRTQVSNLPTGHFDAWVKELRDRFEHLHAHLVKHMALEEAGGYLSAVVERRPTLSREVDRLKHEHREMSSLMDSIKAAMEELTAEDRLLIQDCCTRIQSLLSCVEHHKQQENRMVVHVFNLDLGAIE